MVAALLVAAPLALTSCGDDDPDWWGYDWDWGQNYNNRPDDENVDEQDFWIAMAQTLAGQWRGDMRAYQLDDKGNAVDSIDYSTDIEFKQANSKAVYGTGTQWDYDVIKNEIVITNVDKKKDSKTEGDAELFKGICDGYNVSLDKETDKFWFIKCKKSKNNMEKDDPKTMDLIVEKGTYNPKSLSAKLKGITITMRDLAYGIPESRVTFNPADYPTATIVDKR